jgi:hypothetical protein
MKKLDFAIQLNFRFCNNLKPNYDYNYKIEKNYLESKGKKYMSELTKKQLLELESLFRNQF